MADGNFVTKACSSCSEFKPATTEFFSPRSAGKLRLHSWCKACCAESARKTRKADPAARAKHISAVTRYQKQRAASDPAFRKKQAELSLARNRRRRADPAKKAIELAQDRAWRKANWARVSKYKHKTGALQVAHVARRHAAKLRATPAWSETERIKVLYEQARRLTLETGIEHNVDHIVPLRGRTVCGLHVFANLRIVTEFENKTKANKLIEELCAS